MAALFEREVDGDGYGGGVFKASRTEREGVFRRECLGGLLRGH